MTHASVRCCHVWTVRLRNGCLGSVRRIRLEAGAAVSWRLVVKKCDPLKYFHTGPEIIRLAVTMHVRFPLSLRNVEVLLHERGIRSSAFTPGRQVFQGVHPSWKHGLRSGDALKRRKLVNTPGRKSRRLADASELLGPARCRRHQGLEIRGVTR